MDRNQEMPRAMANGADAPPGEVQEEVGSPGVSPGFLPGVFHIAGGTPAVVAGAVMGTAGVAGRAAHGELGITGLAG